MIKGFILTAVLAVSFSLNAQVVTLFAGSSYVGDGAFSGATGALNKLQDSFSRPQCIVPDTNGRFWITEEHNVLMVHAGNTYPKGGNTGNPASPGGSGYSDKTGTQSLFASPAGCAIYNKSNRIFVCDFDNNAIREGKSSIVNTSDAIVWGTLAGVASFLGGHKDGANASAEFNGPQDIAISSTGVIYIADSYNHCIRKITGGNVSTIVGSATVNGDVNAKGTSAKFDVPSGLYLVDDNTLLVADRNNGKIKKIDLTDMSVTTVVTGLNAPYDVVVINGTYYITDSYCIRTWDGSSLKEFAGKVNTSGYVNGSDVTARFRDLRSIIYHPKTESIYVTDLGNNVFRQVTVSQPPVANFTADKTVVTVGQIVTLTSTSTNAASLLWNITPTTYKLYNGSTTTSQKVYLSFDAVGAYSVELTATNPTGSNKKTQTNYITVSLVGSNKPSTDFYADKTTAAVGETVTFIDQTGDNPQSFEWTFTPNTVTYLSGTTATSRFPKVSFNNTGTYTVALKATNANGNVVKTKTSYITIAGVNVPQREIHNMSVYPNPAFDRLMVGSSMVSATVFDIAGKASTFNVVNGVVQIESLKSGIYFVQLMDDKGQLFSSKFVKSGI